MRTFDGMTKSFLPNKSVVLSDISDCQYSVSVIVWVIFGQLLVTVQRSSWPALTPDSISLYGAHVCDDSAPGNCASVCCVPESRVGCAKRILKAPRFEALCGIAPSTTMRRA